jgi:hypothetical protein
MGLLYYIPARRFPGGKTPDVVKGDALFQFNLDHLAGAALTFRGVRNQGPDGGAGLIIGLGVPSGETGYFASEQEWHPVQGGDLYVGWSRANLRPSPNELLRQRAPKATVNVVLGDGQAWGFVATEALPQRAVFDAAGMPGWAPRVCDEAHYEASAWIFDYVKNGGERTYFDVIGRVAICLGARYHISAMEVIALGLFTTDLLDAVVYACLGIDVSAEEKKSESAQDAA